MQTKQSIKQKSESLDNTTLSKRVKSKSLLTGTLIVVLLIISPYLFTLYNLFPDARIWESPFGTYESRYYESVAVAIWTLTGKLIPLYMLLIWFFTCKHWWYHALLVPICMYTWQIAEILNDDRYVEELDILVLAPIVLIMAIFSYTIRTKIFDKIHGIDLSELSRVSWKGDLATDTGKEDSVIIEGADIDEEEDEEEDPLYMG